MKAEQQFLLTSTFRYKYLNSECLVYNVDTAETLLLKSEAAAIMQTISKRLASWSELKDQYAMLIDTHSEHASLEDAIEHLIEASLLIKTN